MANYVIESSEPASQTDEPQRGVAQSTSTSTENKSILLVIKGRLLRECIESALQRPARSIQSHWEDLSQVETAVSSLKRPNLIIVSVASDESLASFIRIRNIQSQWPQTRWIVLSGAPSSDFVRDAVASGVDGVLLEDSPVEVLRLLTELVLLGHSSWPAELAKLLSIDPTFVRSAQASQVPMLGFDATQNEVIRKDECIAAPVPLSRITATLSDRELDILRCLSEGHSNKMVARQLAIAEATVKTHVKALLRKMQVANRTQAAIYAPSFLNDVDRRRSAARQSSCAATTKAPAVPPSAAPRGTALPSILGSIAVTSL